MKVLMISTDNKILDSGSAVFARMKEYACLTDELDIIVCAVGSSDMIQIAPNTSAIPTNSTSKIWYVRDVLRAVKKSNIHDVDVVTAQDPFETGLAGWLCSRRLKAKLQLQAHTDFMSKFFAKESFKNQIRVLLAKWLLPKANGIRVVSERIKKSLSSVVRDLSKVVVLPIFVDVEHIQNAPITVDLHQKYPQFDFIILMASRLEKEKNIELALEALSEVVKTYLKIGLIIAGSGSEEKELRQKVSGLNLKDNVIFEGWVDNLASYYKTCDAYLSCSNYEGYGMALIMAAEAGRAIITTDVGVVGEVINKDNAMVVNVGDKQEIIDEIVKLRANDDLRKELGKRAKESVSILGTKQEYLEKYRKSWEL